MIAVDSLEQMHAKPLELIGANARRHPLAGLIKIGCNLRVAELPHAHACDTHILEQDPAVARDRNCGVQFMGTTRERAQLLGRCNPAGRLAEKGFSDCERLISADHITSRLEQRDRKRLFASQVRCDVTWRNQRRALLNSALVDISRYCYELDPGFAQQGLTRPALRSENQGSVSAPDRHGCLIPQAVAAAGRNRA